MRLKLTHQDLGQMQMYVNYFDRFVRQPFENPTIGILLCKEKEQLPRVSPRQLPLGGRRLPILIVSS